MEKLSDSKFEHGQIKMTRDVEYEARLSPSFKGFVAKSFAKYLLCNWGDTDANAWYANDKSVREGGDIIALYIYKPTNIRLWISTPADRSSTTAFFCDVVAPSV